VVSILHIIWIYCHIIFIVGRFLFLDLSRLATGQEAKLTTVPLYSEKIQCFSFWYKVDYEFNIGKFFLTVLVSMFAMYTAVKLI